MTCGIYKLSFIGSDLLYVGKSMNIEARYAIHCNRLKKNKHSNKGIANAYLKYGLPNVHILEETTPETSVMSTREIYWIYTLDTFHTGLNRTTGGDGGGNSVDSPNTRYTKDEIIEVFLSIVDSPTRTLKEIASTLNITYSVVVNIASGIRHAWLSLEYPEKYASMVSRIGTRRGANSTAKIEGVEYLALISPEGTIHSNIENVSRFAKLHKINSSNLYQVLKGNRKSCSGWKLATPEQLKKDTKICT